MRPSNVLRIGAISLFLAGWFRELTVVHGQFWPVLVGYAWISMSYPIMLSGCVFVANKWYNDKERALVTSSFGLAIPLGTLVAFTMAGFVFSGHPETAEVELYHLLGYQNIWITLTTIPFILIIRDAPDTPPSLVATQEPEARNFCGALSEVLKIRSYVLLLVIFLMVDGAFISFSDIISEIFTQYNYPVDDISMFGGITVIFGVFSSMFVGVYLQKCSKYLMVIRLVCYSTFTLLIVAIFILPLGMFWPMACGVAVLGMCIVPIIPASMGLGAELTFPMAPAVTNGILLMAGQLGGAIFGICGELLANK